MNKIVLFGVVLLLSACVEQQQRLGPPVPGAPQQAFHPTLYVTPGTVGGVSKSVYSSTEIHR